MTDSSAARVRPAVTQFEVTERNAGQRIDNFLLTLFKGVPRSRIYRLVRKGEVRVNNKRVRPEYRLCAGDRLRLPPVRAAAEPAQIRVPRSLHDELAGRVLAQGAGWTVLDKPSGIAVHGGSGLHLGVIEAARKIWPDERLDLVHRLDRDTSGCLLIATSRTALVALQTQLREGSMEKKYLVLVKGRWPRELREVNAPLRKNTLASGERVVRADAAGKAAITHFRVERYLAGHTLLEARLDTGRTHQIRVHCQLVGHPVVGDAKYGDAGINREVRQLGLKRLFLHAVELQFDDLAGERMRCRAPLPADLELLLNRLSATSRRA